MKPIIKVENLSKQYRLGTIGTGTIREDVQRWWYKVRGKEDPYLKVGEINDRSSKGNSDYVWAIRDINFEVMPGEVLGIIGKNGAGKSTLLKILSKVTGPTTGRIDFNGRIGSLLEVGTGFHPDLTGRENIFLNGAILGMTKREIRSKLDEIIDFSGCERYIDTPVKRYSSGMTVRLGFAVAAHLDPEILIVDEVLAVGDAEFQKKAIGKMQHVSKNEGRTVLFVSHNMAAVSALTNQSVYLKNGEIKRVGKTESIINYYLNETTSLKNNYVAEPNDNQPNFTSIDIRTSDKGNIHKNGADLRLDFEIYMPNVVKGMAISFQILSERESSIIFGYIFDTETPILRSTGLHKMYCILPSCKLYQGKYFLRAHLAESKGKVKFEEIDRICPFEVVMMGKTIEWGWQENVCVYTENVEWVFEN